MIKFKLALIVFVLAIVLGNWYYDLEPSYYTDVIERNVTPNEAAAKLANGYTAGYTYTSKECIDIKSTRKSIPFTWTKEVISRKTEYFKHKEE
ncbi:MAG: hypothetical protein KUG64_10485 [Cycloclasticus sp.]|nr:hypothetical protein [Cycloclasticus sp.]